MRTVMQSLCAFVAMIASVAPAAVAQDGSAPRVESLDRYPGAVKDQVGLSTVLVQFSKDVTVAPGAVKAWGVVGGALAITTSYSSTTHELLVSFTPPIQGDRVTLLLGDGIVDDLGQALDGEVGSPTQPSIPTGDGFAGGIAALRYDVLQGDANGDGIVDGLDAQVVLAALGTCALEPLADPGFDPAADLNGDFCVNVLDVEILLSGLGAALPPPDGTAPMIASISRADGAPLTQDLSDAAITFTEALNPLSVMSGCVLIKSFDGIVFAPSATALSQDGLTLSCHFDPALSACDDYSVLVSSSLADLSGTFLVAPPTAPGFTGSTPPPTPTIDPHPSATAAAGIRLTGTIPSLPGFAAATEIRVQGIDEVVTGPAGSSYSIMVPLKANNLNVLYVSAISPCGIASAPVTTEVTRDNAPPTLTITFPANNSTTFDDAVSVGGFVSDTLNGFQGLSVVVNGVPAIVDVGVGQNGTWNAPLVPLARPGQPTLINVVASDALGNSISKSITVTRQSIPRNAAFIESTGGNNQVGVVNAALAQPIRVKVWKGDGTPWANKVVDFKVTQNDGRLSGSGFGSNTNFYQALTDATGEALAAWTLGSTAGCGNNRVEASAKDVAGVVVFSATALAASASAINVGLNNDQRVETGAPTPRVLSAFVSDGVNPGANVPVTFGVARGGGSFAGGASSIVVVSDITGHADVTYFAGPNAGLNTVEANFAGNPGAPATFRVYGVARDFNQPTSFSGLVLDDALRAIGNVKVSLKFQDELVGPILTNVQGQFEFADLGDKSGAVHVIVDGVTANTLGGQPIPGDVKFPALGYESSIIPNAKNNLARTVHLPPMLAVNSVTWDGQSDVTIACDGIDGLKFTVKANSMTLRNGTHPTVGAPVKLSLNKIHSELIPMPMPDGVKPPFAAEFQPAASTFDPPVEVEFPNMSGLAPGSSTGFLTFNHDTGEFELMAPATVTSDGAIIKSEPGTGLTLSGWHGPARPVAITGRVGCAGRCAQISGDATPQVAITVNGVCADTFSDFLIGAEGTPMHVEVHTTEPDAEVSWTVTPIGGWSGTVLQSSGFGSSFDLAPIYGPFITTAGSYVVDDPAKYEIDVIVTSPNGATVKNAIVKQDWISIIRQEYSNYRIFAGWTMQIPQRGLVQPPIAVPPYFTAQSFNKGNYSPPQIAESYVVNGYMQTIALETREIYNAGIEINSAYRNPQRNKIVNGVVNSVHTSGGAVDMKPSNPTVLNKIKLYRSALGSSTATTVLLEQDAQQLLPTNWNPPDAPWEVTVNIDGTDHTVVFKDTNGNGLPDRVESITPPGVPSTTHFIWPYGGGTVDNPEFVVWDGGLDPVNPIPLPNGVVDILEKVYFIWHGGLHTIDAAFDNASHVHADKPGMPQAPPDANDADGALADWTFDVGGQTVDAGPSGAFFAENVSGLDGTNNTQLDGIADDPIRVVGSTVIDGVTTYAFSESFYIKLNDNVPIQGLTLTTTPPPSPVSIEVDAPALAEVGTPVQLAVTAEMNDGSTQDVTSVTTWTTYRSSNTALATVSANGLVTPLKPGTVFISVFNNSAAAVKKIIVTNEILTTTLVGTVQLSDGTPVGNAVVFTPLGGNAVSQASGLFQFNVNVASQTTGLNVTAVATVNGVIHSGTAFVSPIVAPGVTEVGAITINPGGECDALAWLPTFGGQPGVNIQTQSETPSQIYSVATFDDGLGGGPALYAGGYFFNAGGFAANGVARWDGVKWTPLSTVGAPGTSQSLVVFDDGLGGGPALYSGGGGIRKWNGTSWSAVGSGLNGWADALAVYDDGNGPKLYAGGNFTVSGQTQLNYIARLDGGALTPIGTGMNGRVRALKVFDDGSGAVLPSVPT